MWKRRRERDRVVEQNTIENAPCIEQREMKEEKPNEITETKQNKMKKDNKHSSEQQQQPASNK